MNLKNVGKISPIKRQGKIEKTNKRNNDKNMKKT